MTIATTDKPTLTTKMGRQEAQQITDDIRSNFDSLGKMLLEVRERKGFLALGYQSLESYCLTEFGKGKARVYQLIEEAKIEEGITAELAASDSPIKSLKMPGTYLRELKVLETPRQQIEAIAYANKLANNEGKTKATITHLQAAINKLNPKKVEQTKQILKTIGFDKGAEVEVLEGRAKGERGVIRKIDKKGVHVELYSGNSVPIIWDVSELKVVPAEDRPQRPAMMDTVNIGDTVCIFSSNKNKGKTGEITARINDKIAVVRLETGNCEIPYAELEKVEIAEETQEQTTDLIWAGSWNPLSSWYYNVKRHEIHSFLLPDLTFQPPAKSSSPSDWLEKWRQKNIVAIADALLTTDDLATLVLAATSTMNPEEKEAFWAKVNVSKSHSEAVQLLIENDELRMRLAEAENAIQSMIAASTPSALASVKLADFLLENTSDNTAPGEAAPPSDFLLENTSDNAAPGDTAPPSYFLLENASDNTAPGDTAAHTDFLVENATEISSPGDTAAQTDSWKQLLENNGFTPVPYELSGFFRGSWRGWKFFFHSPNGGVTAIDITNEKQEMWARCTEVDFDIDLGNEEAIINWTKEIINQVEDFCPGQLSFNLTPDSISSDVVIETELPQEILERLEIERDKTTERIRDNEFKIKHPTATGESKIRKQREQLNKSTADQHAKLEQLDKFSDFRVGQTVCHKRALSVLGKVTKLEFSQGGMPLVWVRYFKNGELEKTPTSEVVSMIFTVDI